MNLTGVCLVTSEIKAMKAFYESVFEMVAVGDDVHLSFSFDEGHLSICHDGLIKEMSGTVLEGASNQIIEFAVTDIDEKYDRIKAFATIIKPIRTEPWGIRSFWFLDPEGRVVNFLSNVNQD